MQIWRYAHFYSYVTLEMKKKILKATLLKLHNMASDDGVLCESALDKLHEFKRLRAWVPPEPHSIGLWNFRCPNTEYDVVQDKELYGTNDLAGFNYTHTSTPTALFQSDFENNTNPTSLYSGR